MTLEEKLHEQFDWLTVKHVDASNAIKEIVALHQQEIDEACKKQREICANVQTEDLEPPYRSLGELDARFKRAILNAPSPEVK